MTNSPPSPADSANSTLDGLRAGMAGECARKGPAGALARAILRLMEALMALLADFKAGRLVAMAPGTAAACCGEPGAAGRDGAEGRDMGAAAAARAEGMAARAAHGVWAWWCGKTAAWPAGVAEPHRIAGTGGEHPHYPERAPPAKREMREAGQAACAPSAAVPRCSAEDQPSRGACPTSAYPSPRGRRRNVAEAQAIRPGRAMRDIRRGARAALLVLPAPLISRLRGGIAEAFFKIGISVS